MPITRKQVMSGTYRPQSQSHYDEEEVREPTFTSEDDLFERSAIQVQVTSATRTRTINHQLPNDLKKRPLVKQFRDENANDDGKNVNCATQKTVARSTGTPRSRNGNQRSAIGGRRSLSSKSILPNDYVDIDEEDDDDRAMAAIEDSISRANPALGRTPIKTADGANMGASITVVSMKSAMTPIKLFPTQPDDRFTKAPESPKILTGRKTPLTQAEKTKNLNADLNEEKPVKRALIDESTAELFPMVESTISQVIVEKNVKLSVRRRSSGHRRPEEVKAEQSEGANALKECNDEEEEATDVKSTAETNVSEDITETEGTMPVISAPEITVAEASLPLVISIPPPPTLEDLESLDPELYVKLKSGSLKDDPAIPFITEPERQDIENFLESFASPELCRSLLPVAIIGEGTFSTVYKVIDKNFYECENGAWMEYSRQCPLDWLRLWRCVYTEDKEEFALMRDGQRVDVVDVSLNEDGGGKLRGLLRKYVLEWGMKGLDSLLPRNANESMIASISPRALQAAMLRFRPFFIALKRINATSSPQRILDEMTFLKHLGGQNNVVPLINGLRWEDQVLVTFPYFYCEDFRDFLSSASSTLTIEGIACYMRALFRALAHLHAYGIIHRDVKPSNFLFAPESGGRAVLLDFGLAQKEPRSGGNGGGGGVKAATSSGAVAVGGGVFKSSGHRHGHVVPVSKMNEKERRKIQAVDSILTSLGTASSAAEASPGDRLDRLGQVINQLGPGYFTNDPRAGMKASRAGTRGFRAPEVLFKHAHQTTALDVWSAGVILLTLLTRRYPFFQSSDDLDAILEIACIFGAEEMSTAASLYGRKWRGNVPSVPERRVSWAELCERLNPAFVNEVPPECFALLDECLNLNAAQRICARTALKHPFIAKYATK